MTGFNSFGWDCREKGCFNEERRLKFEHFYGAFPGHISFSDVDGIVEVNNRFLMLEWKSSRSLPLGQEIMFRRLTRDERFTVVVVVGDAKTMRAHQLLYFRLGQASGWVALTPGMLPGLFRQWAQGGNVEDLLSTLEGVCQT